MNGYPERRRLPDPTEAKHLGQETNYEAHVEFSPTSIRVFVPPLPVKELQSIIGDSPNITASAQPYYKLEDWSAYGKLLAAHVGQAGAFL